jgi:hypothetical protein
MGFSDELGLYWIPKMRITQRKSFGQMVRGDEVIDVLQYTKLNQ